jgi:hypothetical protein
MPDLTEKRPLVAPQRRHHDATARIPTVRGVGGYGDRVARRLRRDPLADFRTRADKTWVVPPAAHTVERWQRRWIVAGAVMTGAGVVAGELLARVGAWLYALGAGAGP